jgi:hypothetical protein
VPDERAADYGPDDPVPGDAVMVKGAPVTVSIVRRNVRKTKKLYGFYGTSMSALPDREAVEVACEVGIPHDEICGARAGGIRAAGFDLRRTFPGRRGHFSIIFDDMPSDGTLETLVSLFAECEDNPCKRSD